MLIVPYTPLTHICLFVVGNLLEYVVQLFKGYLYGLSMGNSSKYMFMEVLQSQEPLCNPKIGHSRDEASDAELHYEPPKKGSKADTIIVSDSEEVDQEDELEDNKCKWDAAFDAMLDEEQ
ncbi:hypothetical protein FNV43_RR24612 [Rhamnella rubrinervis]|uniref:Uncharacterized protein n=1 Tax=Rhamnella rubrinervis TaxID=2594499 RepID=A0A8K0GTC3_9ROSA|nr:hypothetical protein FNV43_RR24612 [Rhamnella rubrinervis]